jgi:DNA-directed RNA polymerase specialized sigma24 family protein
MIKCCAKRAAGWFDVDDVLNSARRRLDQKIVNGESLPTDLQAYVNGIATKVLLERLRKRVREHRSLQRNGIDHLEASTELVDQEAVQIVTDHLAADDLALLNLNNMAHRDAAAAIGISVEAYRTRKKRLIARLRNLCARRGGGVNPLDGFDVRSSPSCGDQHRRCHKCDIANAAHPCRWLRRTARESAARGTHQMRGASRAWAHIPSLAVPRSRRCSPASYRRFAGVEGPVQR